MKLFDLLDNNMIKNSVNDAYKKGFSEFYMNEDLQDRVHHILNFILLSDKEKNYIVYNILIKQQGEQRIKDFLACLKTSIEVLLGEKSKIKEIEEAKFLETSYEENDHLSFLIIHGVSEQKAELWMDKIENIESTPSIIRIAICQESDCNFYYENNPHLFHRVFSQHLPIADYSSVDLQQDTLNQLKVQGYSWNEDYSSMLLTYIDQIYHKADLKGKAFEKDLVRRIVELSRSENIVGKVLNEKCIPAYKKEQKEEIKTDKEVNKSDKETFKNDKEEFPSYEDKTYSRDESDICFRLQDIERKIEFITERGAEEKDSNVLLLPLSTFPGGMSANEYTVTMDNTKVTGTYQLDPVMNYLKREEKKFDCVILLASSETMKDMELHVDAQNEKHRIINTSPLKYFVIEHQDLLKKKYSDHSEVIVVEANEEQSAETIEKVLFLLRKLAKRGKVNLTMDNHGGPRHQQVYVEAIMTLLQHENVKIEQAYTVQYDFKDKTNNKVLVDDSFNIFYLVSGINEFLYSGRMESIEKYFEKISDKEKPQIINCIRTISDGIQSGNVKDINNGVAELQKCYNEKEEIKDGYLRLFQNQIYENYGKLLNKKKDVRDFIKWCTKNGLYQQALTFIEAQVPEFLVEKGIIVESKEHASFIAELKNDRKKSVTELVNDCWNWNYRFKRNNKYVNKYNKIHYTWMEETQFNQIFNYQYRSTEGAIKGIERIVKKQDMEYVKLLNELFIYEIKDKSDKEDVKEKTEIKKFIPYRIECGNKNELMCSFILLHKVLKNLRNNANHLKDGFNLSALKNSIDVYLKMLDLVIENNTDKVDNPPKTTKKIETEIIQDDKIYALHVFNVKRIKKRPNAYSLQGKIEGELNEDGSPVEGVISITCTEQEDAQKYVGLELMVRKDEVIDKRWQCLMADEKDTTR